LGAAKEFPAAFHCQEDDLAAVVEAADWYVRAYLGVEWRGYRWRAAVNLMEVETTWAAEKTTSPTEETETEDQMALVVRAV